MKYLITLPWMPYPATDGGKQGSFNMLMELQNMIDITLIYPVFFKKQMACQYLLEKQLPKVKVYPKDGIKSQYSLFRLHRIITRKFLKQPYLATPIYKDAYIDFVNEIIKKERIDIVQNEYFEQLYMVYAIPNTVKKVFIQHEIQYIAKERLIQQREYPSSVRYLATMQRIQEINALNEYDQVITMTDIDKNILMCDGVRAPISASPSFIPLPDNIAYKECERSSICFIGGSGHNPNLNGVTWFLDNVWSLILKENPNFTFKIIGKWDEKIKTEYQKKYRNLFFCGFVDNLAMVISECIMVIPILIGSGIRMKILESVNFYSPFVTTTVGVEGLDFINGKECIIADEPQAFATGVLKIATDKVLQHNLTKAAHEKLMEMYSPEASVQRRLNIYNEMLKR
mgnify:FL=1